MRHISTEGWSGRGLRTKYFPKNKIGHGFLIISPWIDITLLFIFMLLLNYNIVVQPGIVIDLGHSSFGNATPLASGSEVVVLSINSGRSAGNYEDIVYYDDLRFRISREQSRKELLNSFKNYIVESGNSNLVIYADRKVAHGTIMKIMDLARQAGMANINMAAKPE